MAKAAHISSSRALYSSLATINSLLSVKKSLYGFLPDFSNHVILYKYILVKFASLDY